MKRLIYIALSVALLLTAAACANIGRPSGGVQDMLPPVFVKSSPEPGAVLFDGRKIEIEFDELIQVSDPMTKVTISPQPKQMPVVRASGRKVTVEFRDTLLPNTTYIIDFNDAITDNNEGNPLEGFSFEFSTGESVDSLRIAGMVLGAENLEPQQGVLVGAYTNLDDSAFLKLPMERIARTDDRGRFTLRGLKPVPYRLFALKESDRDLHYANLAEDIAFYPEPITPYAKVETRIDTLRQLNHDIDTVVKVERAIYYPNDILLPMFNEGRASQYLVKYERLDTTRLYFQFNTKSEQLPELSVVGREVARPDWYILQRSANADTLTYWLTDPTLIACDTLRIAARYMRTDSAQQLTPLTDTLKFDFKRPKADKKKKKKEDEADSARAKPRPLPKLAFAYRSGTSLDVYRPLLFTADQPIARLDRSGVHLEIRNDTLWNPVAFKPIELADTLSPLDYRIECQWVPGATYKVSIDSAAIEGIYGRHCDRIEQEFKVKELEEYANVEIVIDSQEPAVAELLASNDTPRRTAPIRNGRGVIEHVDPGDYYLRLYIDTNDNGRYDTGNYAEHRQPEDTYYYNKKLRLKKNWDVEIDWKLNAVPVDMQKPDDIKKNKPTPKKWEEKNNNQKNSDEEEEDYSTRPYGTENYSSDRRARY